MFYIVNDIDRPCERYIAEKINGKLNYLNRELKEYDGMSLQNASHLHNYGFIWQEYSDKVEFAKVAESNAQYKDGRIRNWQGKDRFTIQRMNK